MNHQERLTNDHNTRVKNSEPLAASAIGLVGFVIDRIRS
jgi:hypothetical protein